MPSSPAISSKEFDLTNSSTADIKSIGGGVIDSSSTEDKLKPKLIKLNKQPETNNMIPEVVPGSPDVHTKRLGKVTTTQPLISEEGLILPRKPLNPCLENPDRQNLHRELLFNQKIGKDVLNQKSELQRALEKHKEAKIRRETEKEILETASELEKVIADRAKKLMEPQIVQEEDDKGLSKEFLMARAKLRTRTDSK
ncbi:protein FAM107B isoform X2 [Chrysoperla carnea]|uniref:protein FAM107B isoform X2 n=1 Tax=Chrysoperla carnea TaxID=189513 RepID=UPI001D060FBF|nr:protein FAM107B isoform X2 [Chrysoperla carnea]